MAGCRGLRWHTGPRRISPLRPVGRQPPKAASTRGWGWCVRPALWPPLSGLLSYALRPVTTSNASSAMYYRNCWHIFGPRLSGPHAWSGTPAGNCLVRENACSSLRSLTKIPHCCLWRDPLRSQVAGRPQSPARDRWLQCTPNPTQGHPSPAAAPR